MLVRLFVCLAVGRFIYCFTDGRMERFLEFNIHIEVDLASHLSALCKPYIYFDQIRKDESFIRGLFEQSVRLKIESVVD